VHSEAETRAMMRGLLDQAMENSEALLTLGSLEEFLQVCDIWMTSGGWARQPCGRKCDHHHSGTPSTHGVMKGPTAIGQQCGGRTSDAGL